MRILGLVSQLYSKSRRINQHRHLLSVQLSARYNATSFAAAARPQIQPRSGSKAQLPQSSRRLENLLKDIDLRILQTNRVPSALVVSAIKEAQREGRLNAIDGSYLLRSTGELLREYLPAKREALASTVWDLMDKSHLDVSHYNALLRVYLENGTAFDPQSFLAEVKERNIQPNRVTYQRLIQRFCDTNDMDGATKVLEFMKSEQMPISEKVFHALIKGHLLAGDEAAAFQTTEIMTSVGLKPTTETFTVLASGLIEKENKAKALEVIEGHSLSDKQLLHLVKAFALKDDIEMVHAMLGKMPLLSGCNSELINTFIELLSCKKLACARAVFEKIPHRSSQRPTGNLFITQMIQSGFPASEVVQFCAQLEEAGLNKYATMTAVKSALSVGDRETAIEFLKLLPARGFYPLRTYLFAPIICKATNEEHIYDTLRNMNTLGATISEGFLVEFVLPRLNHGELGETTVTKLCESGCLFRIAVSALAQYLLSHHQVEKCLALLQSCSCELNLRLVPLVGSATNANNVDACIEILHIVVQSQRRQDSVKQIQDLVNDFLNAIEDTGLRNATADMVKKRIDTSIQTQQTISPKGATRGSNLQNSRLMLHELEDLRKSLEEKNLDTKDVLVQLLIAYCRTREVEKVEEIMKQLDGHPLNGLALSLLIDFNVFKRDIETALKYYRELELVEGFVLKDNILFGLATILVQEHRLPEAKEILARHSSNGPAKDQFSRYRNQRAASRLIEAVVSEHGTEEATTLVDEHISRLLPITGQMLLPLVKFTLENKGLDECLATFKDIANKYEVAPNKFEIAIKLIEEKREVELEQMIEVCTRLYGKFSTDIEFASYYAQCGHLDKALSALEKVPLNRMSKSIESQCQIMIEMGQINLLETFVDLLDKAGYNLDSLYYLLLRGYSVVDDLDKVAELWTKAQERDLVLSARTLRHMARLLQRGGRDVPFMVPPEESVNPVDQPLDTLDEGASRYSANHQTQDRMLNELIVNGKLQEAFDILKESLQNGRAKERLFDARTIASLLVKMAKDGMIDQLDSLWPLLSTDVSTALRLPDALGEAYITVGKLASFLDKLEKMPQSKEIGARWVHVAIETDPDCIDSILEVGKRFARETFNYTVLSTIWLRLFMEGKYSEVAAIVAEFPAVLNNEGGMGKVLRNIRKTSDEVMCEHLLAILKTTHMKRLFAIAASTYINILLSNDRVDEAQERLKQLRSEGLDISLCDVKTLEMLKRNLALFGKDLEL